MTETAEPRRVGAYAKLLANYASDDALIEAGEAAELLFVRGLAFCATSDADGFITDAQVVRYVGAGMKDAMRRAHRLAECGPWIRLEGGFLVRSWTKLHPTAEQKGRRRRADRERKRKTKDETLDSNARSEQIPHGIPAEDAADSLSMTRQDTTPQDTTTVDSSSQGGRPETLRLVPATEPPENPSTPGCTRHPDGNPADEPCGGCRAVKDRVEKAAARVAQTAREAAEARSRNCPDCHGSNWLEDANGKPTDKCGHGASVVVA